MNVIKGNIEIVYMLTSSQRLPVSVITFNPEKGIVFKNLNYL